MYRQRYSLFDVLSFTAVAGVGVAGRAALWAVAFGLALAALGLSVDAEQVLAAEVAAAAVMLACPRATGVADLPTPSFFILWALTAGLGLLLLC